MLKFLALRLPGLRFAIRQIPEQNHSNNILNPGTGDPQSATLRPPGKLRWAMYAFSIFWGAYLLFQIEPLIGKFILPWFGGSPAIWTSCMLFFQVLMLAGYAYAHLVLHKLSATQQGLLHIALLSSVFMLLPVAPTHDWQAETGGTPILDIPILLLRSIGLPFFILATTSPLLQAWFVRICPHRSPYPLYALSNFGSLLALISYPFLIEPFFKLSEQTLGWSAGCGLFLLCCAALAADFRQQAQANLICATPIAVDSSDLISESLIPWQKWFFWLALPAATSILLLAVTNQLCQDVASVPFLWIVPLSFYLVSFIFCFAHFRWYRRRFIIPAALAAAGLMVYALYQSSNISLPWQISIYSLGLFFCCMICHGELYRFRPHPNQLTAYYLAIALGGAGGGLFAALLAPLLFKMYLEFHIGLFACFVLLWLSITVDKALRSNKKRFINLAALLALTILGKYLLTHIYYANAAQVALDRNFYGILRVEDRDIDQPKLARRILRHGAINHGFQYLAAAKRAEATAYYWRGTGVGLALQHFPKPQRRIGIVGLGVGTLLSYGKTGDYFRLYDINPKVIEFAQNYFSFLRDTPAAYDLVSADARLALERESPQAFDMLVLDAFSGDAVPMHLLSSEAMQLYFRHLLPDGVLAIHITNHYLNFRPLLQSWAAQAGYDCVFFHAEPPQDEPNLYQADWALISRNQAFLQQPALAAAAEPAQKLTRNVVWTDDFSNLFSLLK